VTLATPQTTSEALAAVVVAPLEVPALAAGTRAVLPLGLGRRTPGLGTEAGASTTEPARSTRVAAARSPPRAPTPPRAMSSSRPLSTNKQCEIETGLCLRC
jgi:hypothetical protein